MDDADKPTVSPSVSRAANRIAMRRSAGERRAKQIGLTVGVMACLVAMALGTVAGHLYWGSETLRDLLGRHGVSMAWNAVVHRDPFADWTPEKQFPGRRELNVLILGCDYDYDDYGRVVKGSARSDAILVAHVDFATNRISALTIPRDSAVHIPGHHGIHKINAAHALGGPQLAEETIQSVFGITPDYYVVLNFQGFQKVVDAIGGVDVNVRKQLDYDDNWGHLHIHLKPGYQHLDGYRAMGYVRMRHSDSDLMRSERQHEFLEAVRAKLRQPSTFLALPKVVNTLHNSLQHDLTDDQMYALMNFARRLPREYVAVATLPSFEGPSYVTIDPVKSAELIRQMFYANQMVALNVDAPDPNSVRSMNAPYERGHGRHSRRRGRGKGQPAARPAEPAVDTPPSGDLSVEPDPSGGDSGTSGTDSPGTGGSGGDAAPSGGPPPSSGGPGGTGRPAG